MSSSSENRKLAVIGASYLQIPLVTAAHESGLEVHCFAWEKDAVARPYCDWFYPISIMEKEQILSQCRDIRPHGIVSIGSDLAVVTVNYVAERLGLVGNSWATTLDTTNKFRMREKLVAAELPCPAFCHTTADASLDAASLAYPVIVKPTDRSGSRGVTKVLEASDLPAAVARAAEESFAGEVIVEEFVEAREISVESISWQGTHYPLAITDKVTSGPPYFVELEHHQPSAIGPQLAERVLQIVRQSLTCLGVTCGASHSELMITADDRIFVTEIGARMGGDCIGSHLVQYSTGYDFLRGVIEVALGQFQPPESRRRHCSGIRYVFPDCGRVFQIVDRTSQYPEIVAKEVFVQPGDVIGEVRDSAARPGYYIYQAPQPFVPDLPPLEIRTESS